MNPQEQEVALVNIPKLFEQRKTKMSEWEEKTYNRLIECYKQYGRLTEKQVSNVLLRLLNVAQGGNFNNKVNTSIPVLTRKSSNSNSIPRFDPSNSFNTALTDVRYHNFVLSEIESSGSSYERGDYNENWENAFKNAVDVISELQTYLKKIEA